jgi:benzoate-CoA ligase family protein
VTTSDATRFAGETNTKLPRSTDWQNWTDPEIPEIFNPTERLLDKYIGSLTEAKTALIVDDAEYSYGQLLDRTCRAAGALTAIGLEADSRILMFGTDSADYIAIWLGAVRAGIVPAVVSDLYKAENLLYFIRDTAAKALYIDGAQLDKLLAIRNDLPETLKYVIVHDGTAADTATLETVTVFESKPIIENASSAFVPLPRHRNDVCYMFYSGGTTGTAKGITHLAHDFILVPERQGAFWEYTPQDIVHATSKKYFTHGLWPGVLIPLYWGATSVVSALPPGPENVLDILSRHNITKLITVPTIVKNVMLHIDQNGQKPDTPALKLAITASEKMAPEIFEKFYDLFGIELLDSIGSSEITYEWIANRQKEFRRGSLGKPVFGFDVRLVDIDGNDVTTPDTDGEAWINSVTGCFFYWRKFDKSRETFIGPWVRTGDTLYYDEDGYFWFSGRSDDVFKVKGLWVSPIEVEAAITENESILEAAVISYEDTDGLTKPKAFVVVKPGITPSDALADEIRSNVRAIGGYKVPEEIGFVDAIPRTTLMKIDRRTLRLDEAAGRT